MPMLQRLLATMVGGAFGLSIAGALDVPVWRDWPPGDATDLTVSAMMLVWVLTARPSQ